MEADITQHEPMVAIPVEIQRGVASDIEVIDDRFRHMCREAFATIRRNVGWSLVQLFATAAGMPSSASISSLFPPSRGAKPISGLGRAPNLTA
jgi:hypothetical protein